MHKLRSIHDAKHAITKAYDDAVSDMPEERRRKTVGAASAYLKRRVEEGEKLPAVEAMHGDDEEEEEEEVRAAALEYVTADNQLPKEMFIELMNMMLPKWEGERKRA